MRPFLLALLVVLLASCSRGGATPPVVRDASAPADLAVPDLTSPPDLLCEPPDFCGVKQLPGVCDPPCYLLGCPSCAPSAR